MTPDYSRKTLWTGLIVSVTAFALHTSGVMAMDGLNPAALAGCATTGENYAKPTAPPSGVHSKSIHLKNAFSSSFAAIAQGQAMNITTDKGKLGPLLLYGANAEKALIYAYGPTGQIHTYRVADIQHIQIIVDGNKGKAAGWGAGIGGGVGLLAGLAVMSGCGGDAMMAGAAIGAAGGTGYGALGGLVVGAIQDIDDDYTIGPDNWQIHIPAGKVTIEAPGTDAADTTPDAGETQPVTPSSKTQPPASEEPPAEAQPTEAQPSESKPAEAQPTETKPDEKPKTVKDFLRKKNDESETAPSDESTPK